jgi:hypothetical protein
MFDLESDIADQILSWKHKYEDIYIVKIIKNIYIFRLLTRGEYFDIVSLQDNLSYDTENFILNNCLLYPSGIDNINNRLAGDIDYIIQNIVRLSGFSKKSEIIKDLDEYRNKIGVLDNQITVLICKAFPQITPEDINKFNYNKLLKYITIAEAILDTKIIIEENQNTIDFEKDNTAISGKKIPDNMPIINKRGDVKR